MRGTVVTGRSRHIRVRFIPACAGNSKRPAQSRVCPTVHPRVCGEQTSFLALICKASGSSPRVRGTAFTAWKYSANGRFIPACAGNSASASRVFASSAVHPRVCGEQTIPDCPVDRPDGSSPRVRGTDEYNKDKPIVSRFIPACAGNSVSCLIIHNSHRFIPACAGNSATTGTGITLTAVHPRVCGEQLWVFTSPQMNFRFIPACAGNSWLFPPALQLPAVHPRVCGEQGLKLRMRALACGSSPRVRGTADQIEQSYHIQRFIPACAGNSSLCLRTSIEKTVHPRVCGEQRIQEVWPCVCRGSSPRVRGTGCKRVPLARSVRFIPACAGNRARPW